jgi:hypothetical protein
MQPFGKLLGKDKKLDYDNVEEMLRIVESKNNILPSAISS